MKEIPILFSTQMVHAILEGRKTMTRRIVKTTQKGWNCQNMEFTHSENILTSEISKKYKRQASQIVGFHAFFTDKEHMGHQLGIKCRFGQPGDVLWVRETWMDAPNRHMAPQEPYYFKASQSKQFLEEWPNSWSPSIHMPKVASRIWLQVEEIRMERLKIITEDDAKAEGIEEYGPFGEYKGSKHPSGGLMRYRAYNKASRAFEDLWNDINGENSWKANPWVWVVKFKVLSITGKPEIKTTHP